MVTVAQVHLHLQVVSWLSALHSQDMYWQVPIHPRFRKSVVLQEGSVILQFKVLPFGLCLILKVFMKLVRVVASQFALQSVDILMYLND